MAQLKFLKGNYNSLKSAAIVEGQILICGDTAEMFVDVSADNRVKIGDFTVVANITALEALDATSVPTSRLYYVEDGNILARSNGTNWIQVNKQPTTEELKTLLGLGTAAYTDATDYDTAGAAQEVRDYVGEIPSNYSEETIVAYINKKAEETLNAASGGSSESAASVLAALNTYKSENDPKVQANTDAITTIKDGTTIDSFADVEQGLNNKVDKVTGKSLVFDTEITKLAGVSTGANKTEASTVNGEIKIDGVATVVYKHPQTHAISEIAGLQDALNLKLESSDIANKADKATTLGGYGITDAYTSTKIDELIAAEKGRAEGVEGGLRTDVDKKVASITSGDNSITIGGTSTAPTVSAKLSSDADNALTLVDDGLKVVIPTATEYSIVKAENSGEYAAVYNLTKDGSIVGASINIPKDLVVKSGSVVGDEIVLVLNDDDNTEIKIPVGSLIEYVTSGSTAGDMIVINISDDHKVTATITDGTITLAKLSTDIQTAIGKAHSHENKTVIDGISDDKVNSWDAAEQNAKDYADGLNTAMDTRVKKLENNEAGYATTGAVATAKQEAIDAAANDAEAKVKALADGAVATNTSDIADLLELLTWGTF